MLNGFSIFDFLPFPFFLSKLAFSHISFVTGLATGRVFFLSSPFIISYFPRLSSYPLVFYVFLMSLVSSRPAVEVLILFVFRK